MIDWTKPVRQRGSKEEMRVLCTDGKNKDYPVIIENSSGFAKSYTQDGIPYGRDTYTDALDIENVPEEPLIIWVPIVSGNIVFSCGRARNPAENEPWLLEGPGVKYIKFKEVRE